ncbi:MULTISPECIES: hypothetical protein [Streptomyces]|uniref:hypothetical protein n=1 Tax=Streptomyces TaxID=1883 RepID=UPI0033F05739
MILTIDQPRSLPVPDAARAVAVAFDAIRGSDPSYGGKPATSSIRLTGSTTTTTLDMVPLTV